MDKIVNNFLLAGDRFMFEMYLRQPGFVYSAWGLLTKREERTQKFKEKRESQFISQNELDKTCFQHGKSYGNSKDLPKRIASDKILHDKAFNIAKN